MTTNSDQPVSSTVHSPADETAPGSTVDGTTSATSAASPASAPSAPEQASSERPSAEVDVSSPAKVMRIGTMVKQLLDEVRNTDLDEKGRERLAKIHRRSIEELEDGLSKDLIDELERLDLPFDTSDGPPTNSELRIAQAQLVGWLEGLFHGIQTAIMAQQAMAQQGLAGRAQLPPGMVPPGAVPGAAQGGDQGGRDSQSDDDKRGTGNYL